MKKSETDHHWNQRAANLQDDTKVNIADIYQPELERDVIFRHLQPMDRLLEVGCGNGATTNLLRDRVAHVDAFDYAENMVARARQTYGERNNRFFHDNILEPKHISGLYSAILCVRVLINLRNFNEQLQAVDNMIAYLDDGGRLILAEGYQEGFEELSKLRMDLGMPPIKPADINYYSRAAEMRSKLETMGELVEEQHLGTYDFITRIVYPLVVGAENVETNSEFSEKAAQLSRIYNPDAYKPFARVRVFVLVKT